MREAYHGVEFITNDQGHIVGVSLGSDYCAEHEWGISGIKGALGIWSGDPETERTVFGRARHIITKNDQYFSGSLRLPFKAAGKQRASSKTVYYMTINPPLWNLGPCGTETQEAQIAEYIKQSVQRLHKPLHTYWDSESFLIVTINKEAFDALDAAFKRLDITQGIVGRKNPFSGSGPCFLIDSLVDSDWVVIERDQREYLSLWDKVHASGVIKKLANANCRYYALSSPRCDPDNVLRLWLNPTKQDETNYGWFTLDELNQWAEGKGPIPKETKK